MDTLSDIYFQNLTVKKKFRLCKVNKELGYFHCWEQYADVIDSGLTIGSHPGGQYSRIFGIVEFDDRIERVDPTKIQFIDETHNSLHNTKRYLESFKKVEE